LPVSTTVFRAPLPPFLLRPIPATPFPFGNPSAESSGEPFIRSSP
jgi:hypothetical protein